LILALISAGSFSALSSITKGTAHVNVQPVRSELGGQPDGIIKRQDYNATGLYKKITIPSGYSISTGGIIGCLIKQ